MKYNRKNLVNNALIQGSRDYMKTEFLKGEPIPLNPALFWRAIPDNDSIFFVVNDNGEHVTAITGGQTKSFIKTDNNIYLQPLAGVSEWGVDNTAEIEGDNTLIYREVSYVLTNNQITPTIGDYQEGEPVPTPIAPEPSYDFATNILVRRDDETGDYYLVNPQGNVLVDSYTTKEWYSWCVDGSDYDDQIIYFRSAAEADQEERAKWNRITSEWGTQTQNNPISVTDESNGTITVNGETVDVENNVASKVFRLYE